MKTQLLILIGILVGVNASAQQTNQPLYNWINGVTQPQQSTTTAKCKIVFVNGKAYQVCQ